VASVVDGKADEGRDLFDFRWSPQADILEVRGRAHNELDPDRRD
jgi:hypothetical protein